MKIEVYGPGCANCRRLEANTRAALRTLGMEADVAKVEDIPAIAGAGVMRTPALGVDGRLLLQGNGRLLLQGRVPSAEELSGILEAAAAPR